MFCQSLNLLSDSKAADAAADAGPASCDGDAAFVASVAAADASVAAAVSVA